VTSSRSPRFRDSLRAVRIRLLISGVGCWDASPDRSMKHPAPGVCRRCWDCKRLAVHTLHPDTTETRMQRLLKATASLRGSFQPFLSLPPSLSLSLSLSPLPPSREGRKVARATYSTCNSLAKMQMRKAVACREIHENFEIDNAFSVPLFIGEHHRENESSYTVEFSLKL